MTLATDIASDWSGIDDVKSVTIQPGPDRTDCQGLVVGAKGLFGPLRKAAMFAAMGAVLEPEDCAVRIWTDRLKGHKIRPGDVVIDEEKLRFTVVSASLQTLGTVYYCAIRLEVS